MTDSLRILLIEDLDYDAELIFAALRREGYPVPVRVVASEEEFLDALNDTPDIILSDFRLPGFSGLEALKLLRTRDKLTPFILVSGTVGEETAVQAIQLGATDYLLKDRLGRLVPAIERAIELRRMQVEKARTARELLHSNSDLEAAQERAKIGSWELDLKTGRGRWSKQMYRLIGRDLALPPPKISEFLTYIHPDDRHRVYAEYAPSEYARTQRRLDFRTNPEHGPVRHLSATIDVLRDEHDQPSIGGGTMMDVTEHKHAQERMLRLNRTLEVMSRINSLIIRVRSREDLFRGACNIAVTESDTVFAWIGIHDAVAGKVRPVASAGPHAAILNDIRLDVNPEHNNGKPGLVSLAVNARAPMVVNDTATDQRLVVPAATLREGFGSLIVLPLLNGEQVYGVLALYSMQKNAYVAEELKLLQELAGDVAFALDHLDKSERLDHLAYYDALTGLPNRSLFFEQVSQIIHSARRQQGSAAVILLDPERFRSINISLGHNGGDAFLRQVAARLQSAVGREGNVARIGSDLFAIAISGLGKPAEAAHFINNCILPEFEQPFLIDEQEIRTSARIGVAMFPSDGTDAGALFANAETALRTAKKDLARFAFHAPEINARISETLLLETRLRSALNNQEFVLHYQPKIDLNTGAVVGLEALIRWRDPRSGLVPPGKFIPLLEETGMIIDVGRWALDQAVSDLLEWSARGIPLPRIAVNVSPVQVRQHDFAKTVLDAVQRLPSSEISLDLEITESAIMERIDDMVDRLTILREAGIAIALDDFGTGHSSLAYLSKLPIDTLKIDRSFVMDMDTNDYSRNIVSMICALAQAGQLTVIAEGVEKESQIARLRALGCHQMQGYLISKPLPLQELEPMLRTHYVFASGTATAAASLLQDSK